MSEQKPEQESQNAASNADAIGGLIGLVALVAIVYFLVQAVSTPDEVNCEYSTNSDYTSSSMHCD